MIDGGRYRAKACVGDRVEVSATIFRDGHDDAAGARPSPPRRASGAGAPRRWRASTRRSGVDRWAGTFEVGELGRWQWQHRGVHRPLRHLARGARAQARRRRDRARLRAGRGRGDPRRHARARAQGADATRDRDGGRARSPTRRPRSRSAAGRRSSRRSPRRRRGAPTGRGDASAARSSSSTSSAGARAWAPGTSSSRARGAASTGVRARLPQFAALGIDVLYLPPIHPIGVTARKGRNDAPRAEPGRPRQPVGDRRRRRRAHRGPPATSERSRTSTGSSRAAREHGIEIALDFAVQCSADHPWLTEHPEWFRRRPDGTLKYAENPPKRYRDIYNVDFDCEDWRGLWRALRDVVLYWVSATACASSASTTPTPSRSPFWEWLIESVRAVDPGVVFLSEAFTREPMMMRAREGRLQPVLHVLHLEEHAPGSCATTCRISPTRRSSATSARTSSSTRPTSSATTCSTRAPPASPRGWCSPRRSRPSYGVYSGFERFEATPRDARLRGVPGLREVRAQAARARRPAAAAARRA